MSFAEIVTDKGHDAFLLEEPELFAIVRGFLDGAGKARGLAAEELIDEHAADACRFQFERHQWHRNALAAPASTWC